MSSKNSDYSQYEKHLFLSEPILWKDQIKLYPYHVEDIYEFSEHIGSLLYDPRDYPDEALSSLPQLYFLTYFADCKKRENDSVFIHFPLYQLHYMFTQLLTYVLRDQKFEFYEQNNYWRIRIYTENTMLDSHSIEINSKEFEELRDIILMQNGYQYHSEFLHHDIKEFIQKQKEEDSDTLNLNYEDYLEAIMLDLGITDDSLIRKMTLRRFFQLFHKILAREHYSMAQAAAMSGMIEVKEKIPHWAIKQESDFFQKYFKETKQI